MARLTIHPFEVVQPWKHNSSNNVGGGSGSGDGEGESTIEYLDVSGLDFSSSPFTAAKLSYSGVLFRIYRNEIPFIGTYMMLSEEGELPASSLKAVAINPNMEVLTTESPTGGNVIKLTIKELMIKLTGGWDDIDAIPRITKEQFYSLE